MKYEILYAATPFDLQCKVNKLIEKGWKPQGGTSAVNTSIVRNNEIKYMQAMIKG